MAGFESGNGHHGRAEQPAAEAVDGDDQQVGDDVIMLADGNGAFAKSVGLVMDGSGFGMGSRSQRYSMVVEDGFVKQLNVEGPGEFKVSAADYMLGQL